MSRASTLLSLVVLAPLIACGDDRPPPPRVIAKGPIPAFGIAIDANHVYWTAGGERSSAVYRVTKGAEDHTSIRGGVTLGALTVDERNVYWVEHDGKSYWLLRKQAKDGAPTTPETLVTNGVQQGSSLRSDGTHVYWNVEHGGPSNLGVIRRVPSKGGAVQELAAEQKYATELQLGDDGMLYWLAAPADGLRTTSIRRMPKGGGAVEEVARAAAGVNALAIARGKAVWSVEEAPYELWSCEVATCLPRVAQGGARYHGLGITDGEAWFWSRADGFVRLSPDLREVAPLGEHDLHYLVADGTRLFGVSSTSGEVRSLPKTPR